MIAITLAAIRHLAGRLFKGFGGPRDLPSFPTRRSSDLRRGRQDVRLRSIETRGHRRPPAPDRRSEEHTSELQSQSNLVCRLLLEKKTEKLFRSPRASRVQPATSYNASSPTRIYRPSSTP